MVAQWTVITRTHQAEDQHNHVPDQRERDWERRLAASCRVTEDVNCLNGRVETGDQPVHLRTELPSFLWVPSY